MKCQSAQYWLLQAISLRSKSWPSDIGKHVDGCASCAKFARDLREIEDEWREQELPAGTKAKAAFLAKLRQTDTDKPVPRTLPLPSADFFRRPVVWASCAAGLLIVMSLFAWMISRPGPQPPSSDVVNRILDLHLELTAAKPDDRRRLLDDNQALLREELKKSKSLLSQEEWDLGERLLADGAWLAENDDPLEESKRINELANKLSSMTQATAQKKDKDRERDQYELRFMKVLHFGVQPAAERVNSLKPPDSKFDPKSDPKFDPKNMKKPPTWFGMSPQQFAQKQMEIRREFEALSKKGFGGFGSRPRYERDRDRH